MHGVHGVAGPRSMPKNCGMEGMHGNTAKKQPEKLENEFKPQNNKLAKLANDVLGSKFDLKA